MAGAETHYYALTEDQRSQAIKGNAYKEADPDVAEAINNLVCFFDWARHCRNNLLHPESYPSAFRRSFDDLFTLTKRAKKSSGVRGYMTLELRQVRAIADDIFGGVRQCVKISLFLRYAGRPNELPDKHRKYALLCRES